MRTTGTLSVVGFFVAGWFLYAGTGWAQEFVLETPGQQESVFPTASEAADKDGKDANKAQGEKDKKEPECPNPWLQIPVVRIFPRLGNFPIPPSGPGYYSLLDVVQGNYREKPPRFPYPPFGLMAFPFFDADFRYLDDPKNTQHDCFDPLHRCHLGCNWLFNTGGEFRWRGMNEINRQLSGLSNTYDLVRTRVYGDLCCQDDFRFYVEYLDGQSFNHDLRPLQIDVDRSDFVNLFFDVKICEFENKPVYARVGRQELLFGSERLISPLDWATTLRTFQGVRAFRQGEKHDVDLFWVQPVVPDPANLDSVDNDVNFVGLWTTYRKEAGRFFDLYYLWLDDASPLRFPGEARPVPFNVHTLGTRTCGDKDKEYLWDVELMLQLGERGSQTTVAGAATVGGGYHCKERPLDPTFWIYYDFASGDQNPGTGPDYTTFNQLFPFGHYYLGWLDLVGRQNMHDVNAHLFLYPAKWITVWTQVHHFELAAAKDALYNGAGVPIRRDPTGRAGHNVGDEIDVTVNFHLGPHSDILTGYSQLFAGNFIRDTAATPAAARAAELFYVMYNFRW